MPGIQRIAGRAVALERRDVDTDQIIPAAWLKRVERTGFAAGLFGAWRADPDFDATYHVRLCDLGHIWEVRCTAHGARVRKGATRRRPDVTLSTDCDTWMRLRAGELSGVEAFQQRLLDVRGDLDQAVGFEGMFRLPNGRPPLLAIHAARADPNCRAIAANAPANCSQNPCRDRRKFVIASELLPDGPFRS